MTTIFRRSSLFLDDFDDADDVIGVKLEATDIRCLSADVKYSHQLIDSSSKILSDQVRCSVLSYTVALALLD